MEQVQHAKEYFKILPKNNAELLYVVDSMNLINAALKSKEYRSKERKILLFIMGVLKPKVLRLLNYMLQIDLKDFDCDFYVDTKNKNPCAY
ncbi:hypothetical protein [Flavobacterium tructae]|uniref:Uncharacterized protein n=1 Tax=Flavobacterium tructae TaxID=1114873 RepID=A0A1S1J2U4_9FLAO|nr:hypothetical protein [Flavobacterium tructae]OHT44957.1 hypothetical protein BHE19_09580 [Flavobacterium tructae]OXB18991.1 hypothetical protein B0A71_13700 [Flavobacterium tructae]